MSYILWFVNSSLFFFLGYLVKNPEKSEQVNSTDEEVVKSVPTAIDQLPLIYWIAMQSKLGDDE